MRKMIIDTDTASDDAVAIAYALRTPEIHVEAITIVAGNVPLGVAVKNALVTIERTGSYQPPVYAGAAKPLLRKLFTSEFVHGPDGMGDMNLEEPMISCAEGHAVDTLIRVIMENPGEIELVTLGPLTNVAIAFLREPRIADRVKSVFVMGGTTGFGPGNITPVAEFNIYVDAEAARIVADSGMPMTFVGWDVSMNDTFITEDDMAYLKGSDSKLAQFCVRCNMGLYDFNWKRFKKKGFDLPDPVTMVSAICPDIILEQSEVSISISYRDEETYGQMLIDRYNLPEREKCINIVTKIDAVRFKEILFSALIK